MAVDRDRRCLTLLVAAQGGVDVEERPGGSLARIAIDPLLGLRDFHVAAALRSAGFEEGQRPALAGVVRSLHRLAVGEDAELVEINPLVITGGGDVVAADAKIVLDDNCSTSIRINSEAVIFSRSCLALTAGHREMHRTVHRLTCSQ